MNAPSLPAAVAAANAMAAAAEQDRRSLARAFRMLMRERTIGTDASDLAAEYASHVAMPDGTSRNDAIRWDLFDRLDKGTRGDFWQMCSCVLTGDAAGARDVLLRAIEDIASSEVEARNARMLIDKDNTVYELR